MCIYLYVKTHQLTGLKYLGKTSANDPHKYQGSGLYWSRHIKQHGYNVDTEILRECYTVEEVAQWGEYYSKLWDVENNKEWANLKPESGDGGFEYINNHGLNGHPKPGDMRFVTMLRERQLGRFDSVKQSEWGQLGGKAMAEIHKSNMTGFYDPNFYKNTHTAESTAKQKESFKKINHSQGAKNSQFGTCWITLPWANISRRIKLNRLPDYIDQGWVKGMTKRAFTSAHLL